MQAAMIYARVSTSPQSENYSLSTQIDLCRQYCERKGYHILGEWQDAHSGTESDRPAMNAMIDAVAVQKPTVIVMNDVDRLGRETLAQSLLESELTRYGARIEFVSGGTIGIGASAADEMLTDFKKLLAKADNRQRTENFRRGKRGRIAAGNVLPSGGMGAYGYAYVSDRKHEGQFIINEQEAKIVRDIYHWLVTDRVSSYEIAKRIHALNVPTRGDISNVPKQASRGEWSPTTIRRIINNPIYKGEFVYGKNRHIKVNGKRRVIPVPESEWLIVPVPAIVDSELWQEAQAQLSENKHHAERPHVHDYLLRGMIFCTCGGRWGGHYKANFGKAYYRCAKRESTPWRKDCDIHFTYRQDQLDNAVWRKIVQYLLNPDTLIAEVTRQRAESGADAEKRVRKLEVVRKEIVSIDKKLTSLLDQAISGDFPQAIIAGKRHELVERRNEFLAEIARLENEQQAIDITPDTETMIRELADSVREALPVMTFEEKRRVLELLRTRVDVINENSVRLSGLFGANVTTSSVSPVHRNPLPFSITLTIAG